MDIELRPLKQEDWIVVAGIYKEGIETGNATFQKEIPTWDEWNSSHLKKCRIVACREDEIAGWAALTAVSGRCVYAGVAEVSVYVSERFKGQKVGTRLLEFLISESEKEGFWTLQAGIFPENTASLKLHENLGFRKVGVREKIGKMHGFWRDTVLLERRSKIVGI
ncbi:MAG: N-acetyltransferase family protein [Bacteroidales bacterium]